MSETIQPPQTETDIKELESPEPVTINHMDGRKTTVIFLGDLKKIENGTFAINVETPSFEYDRTLSSAGLEKLKRENPEPENFKKACIKIFKEIWSDTVQQETVKANAKK